MIYPITLAQIATYGDIAAFPLQTPDDITDQTHLATLNRDAAKVVQTVPE